MWGPYWILHDIWACIYGETYIHLVRCHCLTPFVSVLLCLGGVLLLHDNLLLFGNCILELNSYM